MKNKYLLILLASLFTSIANAGDLDLSGVGVSIGTVHSKTAMGDVGNGGLDLGLSYNYDINDKFFVQPSIHYTTSGNNYGDKFYTANIDLGYKYKLENGWTLKPKVGYTYFKSMYDEGSNYGNGYNAGLELGVNKNVSIDFNYHHLNGKESGHYVNLMSVGVKYTF